MSMKHIDFRNRPVTDLPGIGPTYGSRLNAAGYYSAIEIYDEFKSRNFDCYDCQMWLNSVCGITSYYFTMCFNALEEWHDQFIRVPMPERIQQKPFTPMHSLSLSPSSIRSPAKSLYCYAQEPSSSSRESDFGKVEVMQIIAEFRNKQETMAAKINNLEQEKSRTDKYIKTLEGKLDQNDKKVSELQKRHDAKIEELTNKLSAVNRTEQYKNISSSIFLLSQKFDDVLAELNIIKQKSAIHSYVKALETKIVHIEKNVTKVQKQHDEKLTALTNNVGVINSNMDRNNEVSTTINLLAQKLDEIMKQQNNPRQDKSSNQKSTDIRLKHLEQNLRNLTVEICDLTQKSTKIKGNLFNSDIYPTKETKVVSDGTNYKKNAELQNVVLEEEIVEQVKSLNKEHEKSKVNEFKI